MRCISPILIKKFGRRDFVPCGKCNFCLARRRADWSFRLTQEEKVSLSGYFLTLTYSDEALHEPNTNRISDNSYPQLVKRDLQLFTKRLRKACAEVSDYPLRYYAVGEYGTNTCRPHYHGIMFNIPPPVALKVANIWGLGQTFVGDVNAASIHYVTKYVINRVTDYPGREPPFCLMSTRPGLGVNYLTTHTNWHREAMRNYTHINGQISAIPRYYKSRLFTPSERQLLAAEAVANSDAAYLDEVFRKKKGHINPAHYYDESVAHLHDSVTSKINKTNQF